jgi:hypothetical protein
MKTRVRAWYRGCLRAEGFRELAEAGSTPRTRSVTKPTSFRERMNGKAVSGTEKDKTAGLLLIWKNRKTRYANAV